LVVDVGRSESIQNHQDTKKKLINGLNSLVT
jgi:hypothetical protein